MMARIRAVVLAVGGIALPMLTAAAQRMDTTIAMSALREAEVACHRDAGTLWGRSLCGPIALADRRPGS
jgi:hypothetical protein